MDKDELLNEIRRAMDKHDDFTGELFESLAITYELPQQVIVFSHDGTDYILELKEG